MAKILVVGSRKDCDPDIFYPACKAIGAALAAGKHTIVAAGCGDEDAETWVLEGANASLRNGEKTCLIPFSPALPDGRDLIQSINIACRWPNIQPQTPFQVRGPWAVGQAVALMRSDAAILIGGGLLTANVGSLADELDKPCFAISALDGAAAELARLNANKHQALGMRSELRNPLPNDPAFGKNVVRAAEFLIAHRTGKRDLLKSILVLLTTLVILAGFLALLFHDEPSAPLLHLLFTTCAGTVVGVLLAFLVGRVIDKQPIDAPEILGQLALASLLGVLYGFFVLEAGSFYGREVTSMPVETANALAFKMAMVGVGVGALLGPASKRVLEELGSFSKVKGD